MASAKRPSAYAPRSSPPYGNFIQNIINFIIIAFCVFLFVKLMSKLLPKKEEAPKKPARLCPYCKQAVHDEAVKCQHCGSDIAGK